METAPSVDTVYQAVNVLYKGQDTVSKEKASIWLGEFQNSIFAWEISDKLLHEKRDLESCYFAAQTMRSKIQYSFHELPSASYESLRDSLRQHLRNCDYNTNRAIVTQLSLALADLYLQVPSWKTPIVDFLQEFSSNLDQVLVLLEILTVIAEEANSRRLRIGANRRTEICHDFSAQSTLVLDFLTQCTEKYQENVSILSQIFKCSSAWLSVGALLTAPFASSILLERIFQILGNANSPSQLHDCATDCVVQALYLIENLEQNRDLAQVLCFRIQSLQNVYHMCVAQDDSEKLQNFCRLFTELTESLLPAMVDCTDDPLSTCAPLDLLLNCVGHHDYSLAEMSFNVWYRLSELIYQKDMDSYTEHFRPYIERLIQALFKHCRLDNDFDGTSAENEEFSDFRRKVNEVIKDVVFIIGSFTVFNSMQIVLNKTNPGPEWDEAESALFIMTCVAKNIVPDEEDIVPLLVNGLISLPETSHVAILYTTIRLLGELCDWFAVNDSALQKTVQFLVKCMKNPKLSAVATQSLEMICSTGKEKISSYVNEFLELCFNIDQYPIPNDAILALLRATAVLMSYSSYEEISLKLKELCLRQSQPLVQILHDNQLDKENQKSKDPVVWLDRLAAIFRHLNPTNNNGKPHPCLPVVTELWPIILEICDKYQSNARVVEHSCRTLRFMIRSLGVQTLPLLEPLVKTMFSIYQKHPHSCFLYLGSILVDEYGNHQDFIPGLIGMLKVFVTAAFKLLEQHGAMQRCPDTVDDLFRLCLRFVQKSPDAYFQCEVYRPLFQCALLAVSVDHRDASQSVNKFLVEIIDFVLESRKRQIRNDAVSNAEHLIRDGGEQLAHCLIHASVLSLSVPLLRDVAEVLFTLSKLDTNLFSEWLAKALKSLPQHGTLTASPQQLEEFHAAVVGLHDMDSQATSAAGTSSSAPVTSSADNDDKVDISEVRKNWRAVEDFGIAYGMQKNEFSTHFDLNRKERQTMQVDTRLSKTEQKLEDKYAAEYYEQLRLDMEKNDERLAMELQKQLELEEKTKKCQDLSHDEALAKKLQEMEQSQAGGRRPVGVPAVSNFVKKSPSGSRLILPPGLTPETLAAVEEAQRDGTPLRLPPNMTPEQLKGLRLALKDDQRLAQEVQDYELALFLQNEEKTILEAERQRRFSQEQVQNLQNQTFDATTKGVLLPKATKSVSNAGVSSGNNHKATIGVSPKKDESDLISFDDGNAFPFSPPPSLSNGKFTPERPPPPRFPSSNEDSRFLIRSQPMVSLAGSSGSTSFSPGNPFVSDSNMQIRRDPEAIGGIRVLPSNKHAK